MISGRFVENCIQFKTLSLLLTNHSFQSPSDETSLHELHLGHQGVSMMKSNAKQHFFWPQMNADINTTRLNCQHCNRIAPSQPKGPLQHTEDPETPFQQAVTDFLHMVGHNFIIYETVSLDGPSLLMLPNPTLPPSATP